MGQVWITNCDGITKRNGFQSCTVHKIRMVLMKVYVEPSRHGPYDKFFL